MRPGNGFPLQSGLTFLSSGLHLTLSPSHTVTKSALSHQQLTLLLNHDYFILECTLISAP